MSGTGMDDPLSGLPAGWGSRGSWLRRHGRRAPEEPTRRGLAHDPSVDRPHPAANAWPDDAVTLTYAELRRLVALHLDVCRQSMPRERPWDWMALRARAVRDGEVPLLISEVLDQ